MAQRRFSVRNSEEGFALFLSIVMVGVLVLISFAYLHHAATRQRNFLRKRAEVHAQYAAEEALARYGVPQLVNKSLSDLERAAAGELEVDIREMNEFRVDEDFLQDGSKEFRYGFRNLKLIKEFVDPEVSSDARYYALVDGVVNYRLPGLHDPVEIVKQAAISFKMQNFAQFLYFSDDELSPEGATVKFYFSDDLDGRIHSNGVIHINCGQGPPHFYGLVTTSQDHIATEGGCPPEDNYFLGGLIYNYPEIKYPPDDAIDVMKMNAGRVIQGRVYVDSLSGFQDLATTIHMRNERLYIQQWYYRRYPEDHDTIFYNDDFDPDQPVNLPPPTRGTVWLQGRLFLEGWLRGQVTFLSSDTIWLVDDCYYADIEFDGENNSFPFGVPDDERAKPPPGSPNRLGIVSEKNIIIAFTPPNGAYNGANGVNNECTQGWADRQDIVITAALMAMDNCFEVDFWDNSCDIGGINHWGLPPGDVCNTSPYDQRGTIYLWGSIIQQKRGYVQRNPQGPYGNLVIGYATKQYHYDKNFLNYPPPNFPNTASAEGQVMFETSRVVYEEKEWNKKRQEYDIPPLE